MSKIEKDIFDHTESNNTLMDELLDNPFGEEQKVETEKQAPSPTHKTDKPSLLETLPPEYQTKAKQIANQITLENQQAIIQFGVPAQNELSKFSEMMLQHVKTSDTEPIGKTIKDLMERITDIKPEELKAAEKGMIQKVFGGLLKKKNDLQKRYERIDTDIEKISDNLDSHRKSLMKDILLLDKYFQHNKTYFDSLNIYIAGAEYKLVELTEKTLPALKEKAELSNNQMYLQELSDLKDFIHRVEKRVHDLKLSRQISLQAAPQIRMIQLTNQALVEKIQSSVLTTIPLWKNQVAIAVAMGRQKQALEAQKHVSQTTNDLLKHNSTMLKTNSIEAARENERGIIDIDVLKQTQQDLMTTLKETLKIQEDARGKRIEAESTLQDMEQELKDFLLEMKQKGK